MTKLLIRRDGDNDWRTPEVTAYDNEAKLQELLAESPHLLPGIDEGSVASVVEFAVPDTGSADLVTVDAEGEITVVECKLRANPDIRRQVVGQVFAYAAGLTSMTYEAFDAAFSRTSGQSLAHQLADSSDIDEFDEEALRPVISDNLQAGRFRLIIAVDEITPELRRVVRYINQHTTSDVELLAIELGYIRHSDLEILVPEVYGEETVQGTGKQTAGRYWDEESLFGGLSKLCSPDGLHVARRAFDHLNQRAVEVRWGFGKVPSVTLRHPIDGHPVSTVSLYAWEGSRGYFQFKFEFIAQAGTSREKMLRAIEHLRRIPGMDARLDEIEPAGFKKHPSIPVEPALTQPGAVEAFEAAINELIDQER